MLGLSLSQVIAALFTLGLGLTPGKPGSNTYGRAPNRTLFGGPRPSSS